MFKLLIVDDERLDREGLVRQLNWETYRIAEVHTAQSGASAIQVLASQMPDILITDIKMPGMSGLQLAERAKAIAPDVRVVFVSGYDDFEFVKDALRLNAFEYLLKPVDTAELTDAIGRVVADISRERQERQEKDVLYYTVNESKALVRKKLLTDLLRGKAGHEERQIKLAILGLAFDRGDHTVLLLEVDDFKRRYMDDAIAAAFDTEALQRIVEDTAGPWLVEAVQLETHRYAAILSFPAGSQTAVAGTSCEAARLPADIVRDLALATIKRAREEIGMSVTIGVGSFVAQPDTLCRSYNDSLQAMAGKIYEGKGRVLFARGGADSEESGTTLEQVDRELAQSLYHFDEGRVQQALADVFNRLAGEKTDNLRLIHDYCLNILNRVQAALQDRNAGVADIFGADVILWDQLIRLETLADIHQWMETTIGAMLNYLRNRNEMRPSKIIEEVLHYIAEHYRDDISLKLIAEAMFYSPNYLGGLFKQETGKSFSEYLTEYRIRKAAAYLEDYKLKAYEVAAKVGYRDIPTFIKNFKAVFQVTPSEYRERCRP